MRTPEATKQPAIRKIESDLFLAVRLSMWCAVVVMITVYRT